jgi:hypothetical protein
MLSFHLLVTTGAAALLIVAPAFGQASLNEISIQTNHNKTDTPKEKRNVHCSANDSTGQPQTQSHADATRQPPSPSVWSAILTPSR